MSNAQFSIYFLVLPDIMVNEIELNLKDGNFDKVDLIELEAYIMSNMNNAMKQMEHDVKERKKETNRDISLHKNNLKHELDKKIKMTEKKIANLDNAVKHVKEIFRVIANVCQMYF